MTGGMRTGFRLGSTGAWGGMGFLLLGLAFICCILGLRERSSGFDSKSTELETSEMKTIEGMLKHIHALTHDARSGHKEKKAKKDSSDHMPSFLKHPARRVHKSHNDEGEVTGVHSHKHANKALAEAEQAMNGLTNADRKAKQAAEIPSKKKLLMMKKMKALQQQITSDFKSVTDVGKKAGYLPPLKMPHMRL